MKKFLLLSALALGAFSAMAQTVGVTVMGEPVANGGTVTSYCYEETKIEWGDINIITKELNPHVSATSTPEATYIISVTDLTTDNVQYMPNVQICWPMLCVDVYKGKPGTTQPGTLGTTPKLLEIHSSPSTLTIPDVGQPATPWPDEAFMLSCLVEIKKEGSSTNAFTFNLNMIYDPDQASVGGIVDDNDAAPEFFDLSGRRVLNPEKGQILIKRSGASVEKVIL